MNSADKVFTEGLDIQKKFPDLEELQNYRHNICPPQYEESYILDTKQVLAEVVQDRLHQEYYGDVKDCVATKATASCITHINSAAAAYNPALIPDYDELRTADCCAEMTR